MKRSVALLVALVIMLLVPARAWAAPPERTRGALVAVDSYEHGVVDTVIGDGTEVLVPFAAIEIDRPGAPDATVIDANGARLGAATVGGSEDPVARMRNAVGAPARRSLVFYGGSGVILQGESGSEGFGPTFSVAARWRDLLESRVDVAALVVVTGPCVDWKPNVPCVYDLRGIATPSLGARIRLGGLKGLRASSIAVTPSVGVALGAEVVAASEFSVISWARLAPGVAVSLGLAELHARVELPRGAVSVPTFEMGFGVVF